MSAARIGGSEKGMQDINTTDWLCENRSFFFEKKKKGGGKTTNVYFLIAQYPGVSFYLFPQKKDS